MSHQFKAVPLDSPEGIDMFISWARFHNVILSDYHRELATKHGVSIDNIRFNQPMPTLTISMLPASVDDQDPHR